MAEIARLILLETRYTQYVAWREQRRYYFMPREEWAGSRWPLEAIQW